MCGACPGLFKFRASAVPWRRCLSTEASVPNSTPCFSRPRLTTTAASVKTVIAVSAIALA